jgi:5-methylcytosine-specific restriction enzyme B
MSLTRNMPLSSLVATAAEATTGMTVDEVKELADRHGSEAAASWIRSLFVFDGGGRLIEDLFVRTAKSGTTEETEFLAWALTVWSEPRIARIINDVLTISDGRFDRTKFSTDLVEKELEEAGGADMRKAASTLLNRMSSAHLFVPTKRGSTIVGVERFLPSSRFAPLLSELIAERLRDQIGTVVAERGDMVELAILWKSNRWLGLTQDEFRRAARPQPIALIPAREVVPGDLALLDEELRRRRQVVLQGAPGVGKTYVALKYIDWASSDRRDESNLTTIIDSLPMAERAPADIANAIVTRGLHAVWDLTQFHPSYGYEDFVRTLAPQPAPGGVTFTAEHRTLSLLAAVGVALGEAGSDCDVILIVDEINRADIARVFGELLYALEYRDAPVRTPYAVDGRALMTLPASLLLVGTMNTADRSIALIDYALRRRFTFIDLQPAREVVDTATWRGARDRAGAVALFDKVQELFDVDSAALAVGHSYFLPSGSEPDEASSLAGIARRFAYEIVPLLSEYAAEGLIDGDGLSTMLANVGVDATGQTAVEEKVLTWLKSR